MDSQKKNATVNQMWLGVLGALATIGVVVFALYEIGPENEPPPVNSLSIIDAGLSDACVLRTTSPGETVSVHRRPGEQEMIVADLPHDTTLEVIHVRESWVEISGPSEGWVSRRYTVVECE